MKRKLILLVLFLAILAAALFFIKNKAQAPDSTLVRSGGNNDQTAPTPNFDKTQYSTNDPKSIWVVVNKKRPLPSDFTPSGLVNIYNQKLTEQAAGELKALVTVAGQQNVPLKAISGYRSYANQTSTYNAYVKKDGQAQADTYSARPGHSEHQTGLAVDLGNTNGACDLEICFETTGGGKWLAEHAYEYGFIIRYEKGKETLTGYQYEPWHLRYVGRELAREIHGTGQTLEQFFGIPASPNY
jgi:D-alanyl-D-alanine carboxypeptidase